MDSVPGWTSATSVKPAASTTGGGRKPMRRARIGPADTRRTGASKTSFVVPGCSSGIFRGQEVQLLVLCGYGMALCLKGTETCLLLSSASKADVSVRTAGNMNVQNYSQAEATCTAYRSHLCDQAEAESFVANLGLGSTWVAWGAKGCTLEAAKKNWTCGDASTQASQYDAPLLP